MLGDSTVVGQLILRAQVEGTAQLDALSAQLRAVAAQVEAFDARLAALEGASGLGTLEADAAGAEARMTALGTATAAAERDVTGMHHAATDAATGLAAMNGHAVETEAHLAALKGAGVEGEAGLAALALQSEHTGSAMHTLGTRAEGVVTAVGRSGDAALHAAENIGSIAVPAVAGATALEQTGVKAEEARGKTEAAGKGFLEMGAMAGVGLGAAAAATIAWSVDMASKYQAAMEVVHGFAGASTQDMAYYNQAVLQMSEQTGASAVDLAKGLYFVVSAGFSGKGAMDVLRQSTEAAAASGANFTPVADALTTALNSYHLSGSQAARVQDELSQTVIQGKMTFDDFASSLGRALQFAKTSGASLAAVGAGMADLTNHGFSARMAAMALNGAMRTIEAPTATARAAAEALGYSWQQLYAVHGGNLIATFQRLYNAAENGNPALSSVTENLTKQMVAAGGNAKQIANVGTSAVTMAQNLMSGNLRLKELFGNAQTLGAVLMMASDHFKTANSDMQAIGHSAGATSRAFDGYRSTVDGSMKIAKASIEAVAISIGQAFLPAISAILRQVTPLITEFARWAQSHQQLVKMALLAAVALGGLAAAFMGVEAIMRVFGPVMAVVNAAMDANPIVLTALAIIALAAAFIYAYTHIQPFHQAVDMLVQKVRDAIPAVLDFLNGIKNFAEAVGNAVSHSTELHQAIDQLKNVLSQLAGGVLTSIESGLKSIGTALSPLAGLFGSSSKGSDDLGHSLQNTNTWVQAVATVLSDTLTIAVQAISVALQVVAAVVQAQINLIVTAIDLVINGLTLFIDAFRNMAAVVGDTVTLFSDVLHGHWSKIGADVQKLGADVVKFFTQMWTDAERLVSTFVTNVVKTIGTFVQDIVHLFESLFMDLVGASIIPDMINAIVRWFAGLPGKILGILGGMVTSVVGKFADLATQAIGKVAGMISDILGKIRGFVGDMITGGENAAKGLAHGLASAAGAVKDAVGGLVRAAIAEAGSAIGGMAAAGARAGAAFAGAIGSAIGNAAGGLGSKVSGAIGGVLFGHSPPPNNPSFDTEAWGKRAGVSFDTGVAEGVNSSIGKITAATGGIHNAMQLGGFHSQAGGTNMQGMAAQGMQNASASGGPTGGNVQNAVAGAGANGSLSALSAAIQGLPPQFQAAGQAIVANYKSQIQGAYDTFNSKLAAENQSFHQKLAAEHTTFIQKLQAANQSFTQAEASARQKESQAEANARATSNRTLSTYLETHAIRVDAANKQHLLQLQTIYGAAAAKEAQLQQQLESVHGKHQAQQAATLEAHIAALKAATNAHVKQFEAMLGIKTKEQHQLLEAWLAQHKEVLAQHIRQLRQTLADHISHLHQTLTNAEATAKANREDAITKAQAAREAAIQKAKGVLEATVNKINTNIQKATDPAALFSGIQKELQVGATKAMDALKMAIEAGAPADKLAQLAASAKQAQDTLNQWSSKQADVTIQAAVATGDFSTAVSDIKAKLDGDLAAAVAKSTYDLYTLGAATAADTQAQQAAQAAVDKFTAAQNSATAATAANTAAVKNSTTAQQGAYASALALAQAHYDAALAAYEDAKASGASADALTSLYNAAVSAGVALKGLQDIATQVQNAVNAATSAATSSASSSAATSKASTPPASSPSVPLGAQSQGGVTLGNGVTIGYGVVGNGSAGTPPTQSSSWIMPSPAYNPWGGSEYPQGMVGSGSYNLGMVRQYQQNAALSWYLTHGAILGKWNGALWAEAVQQAGGFTQAYDAYMGINPNDPHTKLLQQIASNTKSTASSSSTTAANTTTMADQIAYSNATLVAILHLNEDGWKGFDGSASGDDYSSLLRLLQGMPALAPS